jgi:hypothetical protein
MPDITITITDEEVQVLESFYETAETGLKNSARRRIITLAKEIVRQSSSEYDPDKMSSSRLRQEIQTISSEIPTYSERYPNIA